MGEWLALLSACCFAASNVTIMRGAGAKGQDNGAFVSILLTAGHLLYVAALSSSISRVAMICSMEVFVTIFLTVAVTRSFKQLTGPVLLATSLGVAGTMFIVLRW